MTLSSQSPAAVGSLHLKTIAQKILHAPVLSEAVQSLDPLETYFLVRELGVERAAAILQVCTPEQWNTCIDLACWNNDTPEAYEIETWLMPFLEKGPEALAEAFLRLEDALQTWYFTQRLDIFPIEDKEDIPDSGRDTEYMHTPDGFFVLELKEAYEEESLHPFVLVKALYTTNAENMYRLLTAARWEPVSELEETALHFRTGRMEDLGFRPFQEALRIFAKPSHTPRPALHTTSLNVPVLYTQALNVPSSFTQALASVTDPTLRNTLIEEWTSLINDAAIALGEPPRDIQHLTHTIAYVHQTLCLGLQASAAANTLHTTPLIDIFRTGYAQTLLLKKYALQLLEDPVLAHAFQKSDPHADDSTVLEQRFLQGLVQKRPVHAAYDPYKPYDTKGFESLEELQQARVRLERWAERLK